jgi:hypothetical protein
MTRIERINADQSKSFFVVNPKDFQVFKSAQICQIRVIRVPLLSIFLEFLCGLCDIARVNAFFA